MSLFDTLADRPNLNSRVRLGKTKRDRLAGSAERQYAHQLARNSHPSDRKNRDYSNCHGKGNSSVAFKLGSTRHLQGKSKRCFANISMS